VRSGDLRLRVQLTPAERPEGVGIALDGPFALGGRDPLPVTKMRVTRLIGAKRVTAVLTSTGRRAFVTADGTTRELDRKTAGTLAGGGGQGSKAGALADLGLDVGDWVGDPRLGAGPEVDGTATDRVTGRLRAGRALSDVLGALRKRGANVPPAGDDARQRVDQLVTSARVELLTGRKDRILRRIELDVRLRPSRELETAIPGAGAVRLTATLELRRPNRRVTVSAPG
jgi:hypothetical protein